MNRRQKLSQVDQKLSSTIPGFITHVTAGIIVPGTIIPELNPVVLWTTVPRGNSICYVGTLELLGTPSVLFDVPWSTTISGTSSTAPGLCGLSFPSGPSSEGQLEVCSNFWSLSFKAFSAFCLKKNKKNEEAFEVQSLTSVSFFVLIKKVFTTTSFKILQMNVLKVRDWNGVMFKRVIRNLLENTEPIWYCVYNCRASLIFPSQGPLHEALSCLYQIFQRDSSSTWLQKSSLPSDT